MTASAPGASPQKAEFWPYAEAGKLAARAAGYPPERSVVFESGFGPSGLPHLGTMGEVLRPAYVRQAFAALEPSRSSRLIVFIDDMDGLRKVPESLPDREGVAAFLGRPVAQIPDPFGCCSSFAGHMIGLLRVFLAPAEVDYELLRASEMYSTGRFDEVLRRILVLHGEIIAIVAPTLREQNRENWSPFMPVCPACGQVNSTLVTAHRPERDSVEFSCQRSFGGAHGCGFRGERSVLGGGAKVQWKVDWALRWRVLGVDYELYGKDLIDSARISGRIVRLLGGTPPLGFPFEMYLDEAGHKVSKSIGRGVGVEQWRRYAPIEVLKYFLILNPQRARKLFLESIPQYVDEYLDELRAWSAAPEDARRNSPLTFVLQRNSARRFASQLSFAMIMNLVGALGTDDRQLIRAYLQRYDQATGADPETEALVSTLVECAINYYRDFVEPAKQRFEPSEHERAHLGELIAWLKSHPDAEADEIERAVYEIGRLHYDKPGKIFPVVYKALLGQERGPRLGSFFRLTTPARAAEILERALETS